MDQAFESILSPEFEISPNSKMKSLEEVYAKFGHLIHPGMLALRVTASLCPECVAENKFDKMKIPALVYAEGGEVKMIKECPEHGVTKEKYWEDYDMYMNAK
ncbi:MAG: radical SAM protein, partial [Thermoplasmatales archaeon]